MALFPYCLFEVKPVEKWYFHYYVIYCAFPDIPVFNAEVSSSLMYTAIKTVIVAHIFLIVQKVRVGRNVRETCRTVRH